MIKNHVIITSLMATVVFAAVLGAQTPKPTVDPGQAVSTVLTPQADKDDRYRIGFQDVLDIQVFNHSNLNLRTTVGPNGTINLYRLDKPLSVICKTSQEVAADIMAAYKVSYLRDPQVTVTVAEQKSQSVAVIGAVEHPASYFITKRVHLLELLALAGGPNKEAGTRLIVARTGSSSNCKSSDSGPSAGDDISLMNFKLRDIQEGKKTLWMQPGDVVSVLSADIVYVYGNVNKQGEVKVREPITLRQALAQAEGIKPATRMDTVRIIRQQPDGGDPKEMVLNLKEIDKGTAKDPYLEPNDIVAVSEDSTKKILTSIGNALRYSIPSAITRVP